jgi:o-succinylbenzoate synthase
VKIIAVDAIPVAVPVRTPLRMAGATVTARTCILVRLHTDEGHSGIGEGVVAPYFTGETLASAVAAVRDWYTPILQGADPFDVTTLGRQLQRATHGNSAARSAVDIALHDVVARTLGVPLYRLLGGKARERVPTIYHVSNYDPDRDAAEAADAVADGFRLVKVKVGSSDVDRDVACVRAVRETVGEGVGILPDANQGWSVAEAIRFARGVEAAHPLLIEQPVPRDDLAGMAAVRAATPLVIAADEGVFTARDLYQHLHADAVGGVVTKLIKAGGIGGVRAVADVAHAANIGVHLAGMAGETSIAAAAALHVATALAELRFGSGISPHYLADDVVTNPLRPERGDLIVPEGPGLGVELSEDKVDQLRVDVP